MATDVARLRFIMSADAGGLKSGLKEASGSLKGMNSELGSGAMRGGEQASEKFFHGLSHKARSLRHFARDIGATGALGQFTGLAHMGAAFGLGGLAVGAAGIGIEMFQKHQEEVEKDRDNAFRNFRAAREKGIDQGTYREIAALAGEDAKFLDDMAAAMKQLRDAGPRATEAMKQFGERFERFEHFSGIEKPKSPDEEREQLNLSFEKRMASKTQEERYKLVKEKFNMTDSDFDKEGLGAGTYRQRIAGYSAKYEKAMQIEEGQLQADAEKKNRGPAGTAGAYQQGSEQAWNVIANATMAAQGASNDPVINATRESADRIVNAIHGNKTNLKRHEGAT